MCSFAFQSELYWKDGASVLPQHSSGGLKGYISMALPRNHPTVDATFRPGFGHGVSFFVNVWPLIDKPIASFQVGARARHEFGGSLFVVVARGYLTMSRNVFIVCACVLWKEK
jgi:hypothetical protein